MGLLDLEALPDAQPRLDALIAQGARILDLDGTEPASEAAADRLIWDNRGRMGLVAGSQGVEYALVRHWQDIVMIPPSPPPASAGKVDRIAAVSRSVSLVMAAQLDWARQNGFALVPFNARAPCASDTDLTPDEARATRTALQATADGLRPLVHSATGHGGPQVPAFRDTLAASDTAPETANRRIGQALARTLDVTLHGSGIRRAVISGGDSFGHAICQLGLSALVANAPTITGAALCQAYGDGQQFGIEESR